MKLVPVMDYCLFQFDALKFFLQVRQYFWFLPNFIFFNVNFKFGKEIKKHSNCLDANFQNFSDVSL